MNGRASSGPAVRVEGVVKHFGATVALDGAELEVPAGMVFGLLGPNGAGKTTLVRILATLLAPDGGRAEVLGHDVTREPAAVRELIGLTGQFAAVDELLTGHENLEMFGRLCSLSREQAHRRAGELLERFDLGHAADRPARTYSGGMRRRLAAGAVRPSTAAAVTYVKSAYSREKFGIIGCLVLRSRGGRGRRRFGGERMSMTDHAPAAVHDFQTCTDPSCGEVLCEHYRVGLAAGSEFIRGAARGFARVRAAVQEADSEVLECDREDHRA